MNEEIIDKIASKDGEKTEVIEEKKMVTWLVFSVAEKKICREIIIWEQFCM